MSQRWHKSDYENVPYPMPRQFFYGTEPTRTPVSPVHERYWSGGRVFAKEFLDRVRKDPRRRMAEDLRVIFETLRILPEMVHSTDAMIRLYCQTARYEFRQKNDILYCFGKRSNGGSSGPRRENECLILEPSEMLVFDYPENQNSKGGVIPQVPNIYHQQSHQRVLPVPGHYPNHFSYYPESGYPMDPSVMLRGHARMVESEDHYRSDIHTLLVRGHNDIYGKSQRSSRGSDTSSAYSGSDTLHSVQSSIEAEQEGDNDIDLSGLKESLVDSDEEDDLADIGSLVVRDSIQACLEKDPADRTDYDVEILLEFTQQLKAFSNMTLSVRKAMCRVMVFAVVEHPGTVVMNDNEELDSWSVIVNGQVEISYGDGTVQTLSLGDSFGITPTMDKLYHRGVMRTKCSDCQFVCITQQDYYRILHQGEENILRIEEDGRVVLVLELRPVVGQGPASKTHIVIKGTVEKLMTRLILDDSLCDPTYVEDFLLTHRTFIDSPLTLCKQLLEWFHDVDLRDKVTRVVLLWVTNHFADFETDPAMIEFLERFEQGLEQAKMQGQLRLLNFACAAKARSRTVTLTRSSRDEPLQFAIAGGFEKGSFIFISKVEKGSKAEETGLKRGDQVMEVNGQSFENLTNAKALEVVKGTTHLSITVKSNLLGFKEMLTQPQSGDCLRRGKKDASSRGRSDTRNRISSVGDEIDGCVMPRMFIDQMPCSVSPVRDKKHESTESQKNRFMTLGHKTKLKKVLKKIYMYQNKGTVSDHSSDDSSFPDMHRSTAPSPLYHSRSNPDLTSIYYEERRIDYPEHVLKIYRADQSCKYLLVNKETTAHEVVMLAIREFGITDPSNIYSLCEVTVSEGGIVKQRRLPDQLQNLAERIGLASRYYLKSNTSTEPLVPDELASEIIRDAQVNFLQLQAVEVAVQLTLEDFSIFRQVESTEFIDDLFSLKSKYGTPQLGLFAELVNREMFWVVTEVCTEPNLLRRMKIIKQFIKIARQCKECKNFNSMFAIISGLGHGTVSRLRATWDRLPAKYQNLFREMQDIMDPSRNMSKYRHLVNSENLQPPVIPFYPVVKKDLTFIHLGNDTHVDGLVNFEKLRMIAKEVRTLSQMCSVPYDLFTMLELGGHTPSQAMMAMNQLTAAIGSHSGNSLSAATVKRRKKTAAMPNQKKMFEEAQMVRRVKAYLSKMKVISDEEQLRQMSLEVEPPVGGSSHNSAHNTTTSSADRHSGVLGSHLRKRHPSPTLSTASTASSASANSEGRKTSQSGPKFGAASPQSLKKMLALSEPSKTRPYQPPKPAGLQNPHALSPSPSPNIHRRGREAQRSHERSHSDTLTMPVDLSAESSSVTSLSNLPVRKNYQGSSGSNEGGALASVPHPLGICLGVASVGLRNDIDPGYCTQFESRSNSSLEGNVVPGPPSPTVRRQMPVFTSRRPLPAPCRRVPSPVLFYPVANRPRRPPEYTVAVSSSMSRMAHLNRSRSHDGMFQSDDEDEDGAQVSTV